LRWRWFVPPSTPQATGFQTQAMPSGGAEKATSGDLLYVSDTGSEAVYFYSYPALEKVGQLTGIGTPDGLCTDRAGNVFVTNMPPSGGANILEYAHGGTTPIQTLNDPGKVPSGCAVSPATGDLAVTNFCARIGDCGADRRTHGNILIYPRAKGTPQAYRFPHIRWFDYCSYDTAGNLFADGSGKKEQFFYLVELPKGSRNLKPITVYLSSSAIEYPGGVQWDGKYLAIGNAQGENLTPSVYRLNASTWKLASKITLNKSQDVSSFFIDGKTLIAPNWGKQGQVLFYSYPKGVRSAKAIDGLKDPVSVVVSPKIREEGRM
jgi:DNA-binding beta-propeller fold protein YncE